MQFEDGGDGGMANNWVLYSNQCVDRHLWMICHQYYCHIFSRHTYFWIFFGLMKEDAHRKICAMEIQKDEASLNGSPIFFHVCLFSTMYVWCNNRMGICIYYTCMHILDRCGSLVSAPSFFHEILLLNNIWELKISIQGNICASLSNVPPLKKSVTIISCRKSSISSDDNSSHPLQLLPEQQCWR